MTRADQPLPDARPDNWVDRHAPVQWRPYLRLARIERPIGSWLLLLPCWWSSALASGAFGLYPDVWHLMLFIVGTVAMRGAGTTYNDIVDRDLDAQVARSRHRPLPAGQVSAKQALLFLIGLCLLGLCVLLQFNRPTIILGFSSLIIVAAYPFMKRIMPIPQLVLGLAFAWGGLVGWSAIAGSVDTPAILTYAAAILWTIGYDTIYALQDIEDDAIVGIKSSARLFGARVRQGIAACYAAAAVLVFGALISAGAGLAAYVGLALFAAHLAWQVKSLDPANGDLALTLFKSNRDAGLLLFAGIAADAILRAG
ncbi:4-hydroxybenzoate polyprenyltransferase [Pseudochelatococcus lubricantis]|uniref:4-hydroxybenzoate octaprenyltransferase n=1 Tax=Pseudochelatococcus lubricantis TaxID=1538102 RepID=A0ABX0UU68_9HYPH|nr:4-hydroxybenzoate octaprenyltransferase [Pseudochelatococcus lubricantis]NIJ56508.1 4-hydroxybenzoate polyprenyltransferase [Pseudochelatococcus lubricantis]